MKHYDHEWTGIVTPDGDRWRARLEHPLWGSFDGGGARHPTEAAAWKWCDECAPLANVAASHRPCAAVWPQTWCDPRARPVWCFARPVTPREVCGPVPLP